MLQSSLMIDPKQKAKRKLGRASWQLFHSGSRLLAPNSHPLQMLERLQCFSLTTNQRTVLSAMAFQRSERALQFPCLLFLTNNTISKSQIASNSIGKDHEKKKRVLLLKGNAMSS
jgi:hypothetical protein